VSTKSAQTTKRTSERQGNGRSCAHPACLVIRVSRLRGQRWIWHERDPRGRVPDVPSSPVLASPATHTHRDARMSRFPSDMRVYIGSHTLFCWCHMCSQRHEKHQMAGAYAPPEHEFTPHTHPSHDCAAELLHLRSATVFLRRSIVVPLSRFIAPRVPFFPLFSLPHAPATPKLNPASLRFSPTCKCNKHTIGAHSWHFRAQSIERVASRLSASN
jgi:hypothetical protein